MSVARRVAWQMSQATNRVTVNRMELQHRPQRLALAAHSHSGNSGLTAKRRLTVQTIHRFDQ